MEAITTITYIRSCTVLPSPPPTANVLELNQPFGASDGIRTRAHKIKNFVLYHLSYAGIWLARWVPIPRPSGYEPDALPTELRAKMVPQEGLEPSIQMAFGLKPNVYSIPPLGRVGFMGKP